MILSLVPAVTNLRDELSRLLRHYQAMSQHHLRIFQIVAMKLNEENFDAVPKQKAQSLANPRCCTSWVSVCTRVLMQAGQSPIKRLDPQQLFCRKFFIILFTLKFFWSSEKIRHLIFLTKIPSKEYKWLSWNYAVL